MKKLGVLVFILAVILDYLAASLTSYGNISGYVPQFNFSFGKVKGSGNVIPEQRNVRDFTSVSVSGIFTVDVVAGNEFSVILETDDNIMPLVVTEVSNGELKIYTNKRIRSASKMYAKITMPQIDGLKTSGIVKAKLDNVNSDILKLSASGSSRIDVAGKAIDTNVRTSGASRVMGESLISQNVEARTSGSSRAVVNVSNRLDARSSGSSRIIYSGEPVYVDKDTSGSAKIIVE